MTPYKKYLIRRVLPDDKSEANRLKAKAYDYCIHKGYLYKKRNGGPNPKCLTEAKFQELLKELYEGVCGLHWSEKSLAIEP